MSLGVWAKLMSVATVTALTYIHMQMQIVELAYKGKDKEKRVHELMDNNGILTHQIVTLKSADYLGRAILEKDEGLQFMGHDRMMTFPSPAAGVVVRPSQKQAMKAESPLWTWLSFLSPGEAKAWDR
ncbi:MAG: hypothetical protein HY591_04850 [Candidatus Omnitrophica bacterium]|nr:hypothetical protein [Candidatus Omnitrophota bacterium]